jgi:mannose-1-phosphate guanylyltransferase/mannose-1-phosphate guanylyltransferase/mannose-6-phosphate isomerase
MVVYREERPWGKFERFTENQRSTVKILHLNPESKLSLQYHDTRKEFWKVIAGSATFTIGSTRVQGKAGDEFQVPLKAQHRIETGTSSVTVLEISTGEFREDDVVRIEDIYKRV